MATAALGICLVRPSYAQDGDSQQPRRLPTLTERLQQFREDLFGEPLNSPRRGSADDSSGDRRMQGRGNGNASQQNRAAQPRPAQTPTPAQDTAIAPAQQLKPQSARRAQPGTGAPDVGEADDDGSQEPALAPRRSASSAKRKRDEAQPEQDDEPRMAKSVPLPSTNKQLRDAGGDESGHGKSENHAKPGVLFTTDSPVLSVEATGPRKVMIGKEAQFVVKIRNTGAAANNVLVTINIPSHAEVLSAQASTGTAQAPPPGEAREPLEWKIDRLEAKRGETLNLKLVPRKSAPFDLGVQWTFTPEAAQTLVEVQEPKLAMTIAGPEEVLYGQSKIYKLTVSNPGNGDSDNVAVGLLPLGRASETAASHRLGTLRAGESRNIDIELTARQPGVITIKAQAFADGGLRTEAVQQVLVRRANLEVDVEAPKVKYAGTVGTYHVKVTNAGNAVAENVQVSAILPPDAKYVASNGGGRLEAQQGKVNWTLGTLQPGGQRTFETQCTLTTPGDHRMQFVATADGDLTAAATSSTRVEALADLKLEVRDPQGPIAVGEETVYEVHIRNRGTKAAEGVELAVFFSEGLEAIAVEGGSHDIGAGQVIFKPIVNLPPGETAVVRVRARADRGGNHRFRAEVVCQSLRTRMASEAATLFYGEEKSPPPTDRGDGGGAPPSEPAPLERAGQSAK